MNAYCIVVDANIAFKSLVSHRGTLRAPFNPLLPLELFSPRLLFIELFRHKERIVRTSHLTDDEVLEALHTLLSRIQFIKEGDIPIGTWMEAFRLCRDVDEKDTPYVTLTLHLGGRLWTEDQELKAGLRTKGFDRFFEG